ncbi:integrative and conjugative element protein (TIGR02256 family) [Algoriphagus boseongensis]|uniref:Integrative and conjugative element protein (TIGR02256 family) n=1 Tax=Algoriphagus boseongensis TaxID=1442587 RepID=A0A4V3D235_9BACT|nr:Mov34/MPN/PAD-1 family protein [Algoriphagus boseongensis]TDQ16643.1 integrative and conjugative element protein (TIGR02256 family) [Algoriphagus boseongensis]
MKEFLIGQYNIVLSENLIELIYNYRQIEKGKPESGGILLGQKKDNIIYLLRASTPNNKDKFHRTGFTRNKEIAQSIINYEFYNSGKKTIYLGEWHSHPENFPTPSNQDMRMIKDQFEKNDLNEKFIFLIIVGIESLYIGILDNVGIEKTNIAWTSLKENFSKID